MNQNRYPVPSHNPDGPGPSRIVKVPPALPRGAASLDLTIAFVTAGTARPLAKTVRQPREAHSPEQRLLGSRAIFPRSVRTGAAALDLTFTFDTTGSARPFPKTVRAPREAHTPIQALLESRAIFPRSVRTGSVTFPLTIDFSTSGTATGAPAVPRTVRAPREAHSAPEREPVSRVQQALTTAGAETGSATLDLTIAFDTTGSFRPLPKVNQQPREAHSPEQKLLESRSFFPKAFTSGSVTFPLTIDFSTTGTFETEPTAQPPRALRATQAHSPAEREPVSRVYQALTATGGYAVTPQLGVIVPGGSNLNGRVARIEQDGPATPLLESRSFVYYHAAPPIYRVIVPGGTNQGFQFEPVTQPDVELFPPSRRVKGYAPAGTFTGSVSYDLTIAFDTQGVARPRPVITRARVPHDPLQALLDSRVFRPRSHTSGSVTFPLTIDFNTNGSGGTPVGARLRTLMGVGQ